MYKKRIRLKCCGCGQFFLVSGKTAKISKGQNAFCNSCKPSKVASSQMILIEVQEHAHLLQLYYSLYTFATIPSEENQKNCATALNECNIFFSGGFQCL